MKATERVRTSSRGVAIFGLLVVLTSSACGPKADGEAQYPAAHEPLPRPPSGSGAGDTPKRVDGPPKSSDSDVAAIGSSVHVALGLPRDGDDSDDWLLDREQFVVSYNAKLNAPNWVAWHLDDRDLGRAARTAGFHSDTGLPKSFYVVRDEDYAGSGYDRGHLCPSADRTLTPAMNRATFVFTNVHPQFHELNAGPWEKLELKERELARGGKELFVVAGGIFEREPKRVGKDPSASHRVAVPIASYKIIVALDRGQRADAVRPETPTIAVIMPNEREALHHDYTDYVTSIRAVEHATGYDFLSRVPRDVQEALEVRAPMERAKTALR